MYAGQGGSFKIAGEGDPITRRRQIAGIGLGLRF